MFLIFVITFLFSGGYGLDIIKFQHSSKPITLAATLNDIPLNEKY